MSLRFALLMIEAMALLHRAGMSSSLGESERWNTSVACVCVCLVSWGSIVGILLVLGLGSMRLAVFLSRLMRFSCLAFAFVMGGYSLVLVLLVGDGAIGYIVWARRWYSSMALTTSLAALSIWSVVTWSESRSC